MVKVTPWPHDTPPDRAAIERAFATEGLSPYSWSNAAGDLYSPHSHPYDKVLYVLSGSITFTLPDQNKELLLERGDRLDLPAGVRHGARVGLMGVVCLETHAG